MSRFSCLCAFRVDSFMFETSNQTVVWLNFQAASNISSSPAGRFGVHGALAGVQLPRYSLVAAGAPPRHVKALALPAGFLASNSKGGRLAAVAAGAASPGESDDGLPWEDSEVTRTGDRALFSSCSRARCILLVCCADLALELEKFVKRIRQEMEVVLF
jgi:hypothetical protein